MKKEDREKLQWMLDNDHSIDELIQKVAETAYEELNNDGGYSLDKVVEEAFEIFENEKGFNGEIWDGLTETERLIKEYVNRYDNFIKYWDSYDWKDNDLDNPENLKELKAQQFSDLKDNDAEYMVDYLLKIKNEITEVDSDDEGEVNILIDVYYKILNEILNQTPTSEALEWAYGENGHLKNKLKIKGYTGRWHEISKTSRKGVVYRLFEHDSYGDATCFLLTDFDCNPLEETFDDLETTLDWFIETDYTKGE